MARSFGGMSRSSTDYALGAERAFTGRAGLDVDKLLADLEALRGTAVFEAPMVGAGPTAASLGIGAAEAAAPLAARAQTASRAAALASRNEADVARAGPYGGASVRADALDRATREANLLSTIAGLGQVGANLSGTAATLGTQRDLSNQAAIDAARGRTLQFEQDVAGRRSQIALARLESLLNLFGGIFGAQAGYKTSANAANVQMATTLGATALSAPRVGGK